MDDQKKKMSVWEIIASVVFIGLIAYSFFTSPTDPKNADRRMAFYDALAHSQTDTVALADLTSFPWDSVCFFSECRVAEAQKYVKTVPRFIKDCDQTLILFVKDGQSACAIIGGIGSVNAKTEKSVEVRTIDENPKCIRETQKGDPSTITLSFSEETETKEQ